MFNILILQNHSMADRFVEIPVRKNIREAIQKAKGELSYNQFFEKILVKKND